MKKLWMVIPALFVVSVIAYALSIWALNTETYVISATTIDTSGLLNLRGIENAELVVSVTGSDSVKVKTYVDGYWNGKYDLNVYNDSLIVDNGTGDYTEGYLLRGYGVNNIKGYELIRVRCEVTAGAVDDSSSILRYSAAVIGR
jgi:hypothetical protein